MAKNKKNKIYKIIYNVLIIFFTLVFIGCSIYLISYFYASKKSENKVEDLRKLMSNDKTTEVKVASTEEAQDDEMNYVVVNGQKVQRKFERVYRRNNDFVGWLKIEGTVIDYPVMQTPDNEEFYIDKDFDKKHSSAGTLFIDAYSNLEEHNDNVIVYGHNMKTGKMFHELLEYENEDFYKKHKYIQFNTIFEDATYEVIAAFRTKIYPKDYDGFKYYKFYVANTELEFDNYVNCCKSLTSYPIEPNAKYGDDLITLSTCAYHDDNGRFVVVAKKLTDEAERQNDESSENESDDNSNKDKTISKTK